MNVNIYKELFEFVRSEGERLIIVDPNYEDGLVVLRLSEYKKFRGETGRSEKAESQRLLPMLAEKKDKNLAFWDDSTHQKTENSEILDRTINSGRIHEHKSVKDSVKSSEKELELLSESELAIEESAGDEYYFEPTEEIGL